MAHIFSLPAELLISIFEEISGRELRRSSKFEHGTRWRATERLAICHEWYAVARSIYLSGLGTSDVRLYATNLKDLDGKFGYGRLRTLMHKNTRDLSIKLLGHFWDQNFVLYEELFRDDPDYEEQDNRPPPGWHPRKEEWRLTLRRWRDLEVRPRLDELFNDLRNFTTLEKLEFTAKSDALGYGVDWDYIEHSTILGFLRNLPLAHDLNTLTLDTCGTRLLSDDGNVHLCEEIAKVLPRIKTVHLRMISLCPAILDLAEEMKPSDVKLRTLVIKLNLPKYHHHTLDQTTERCMQMRAFASQPRLHEQFRQAIPRFLNRLSTMRAQDVVRHTTSGEDERSGCHGLTDFLISYPDPDVWRVSSLNGLNKTGFPELSRLG